MELDVKVGIYVVIHFRDFIWMDGGVTVIPDHRLPNPITNPSHPKKTPTRLMHGLGLSKKFRPDIKNGPGTGQIF